MRDNIYLAKLIERQTREDWSDREMARQLRVSAATWNRIRRGERGIGVDVLACAMARFPEYNAVALLFLSANAPDGNIPAPVSNGRAA